MTTIKFAKLDQNIHMPTRKHLTDAGIDLYAQVIDEFDSEYVYNSPDRVPVEPFNFRIIKTGLLVEIPEGHFGWITNKSSKDYLIGGGIIDEGYQGELLVKVINYLPTKIYIKHHEPIAQLLIIPCKILDIEIADLSEIHQKQTARKNTGGIAKQLEFEVI